MKLEFFMFIKVVRCYAELVEAWFNPAPKKMLRQALRNSFFDKILREANCVNIN